MTALDWGATVVCCNVVSTVVTEETPAENMGAQTSLLPASPTAIGEATDIAIVVRTGWHPHIDPHHIIQRCHYGNFDASPDPTADDASLLSLGERYLTVTRLTAYIFLTAKSPRCL